MVCEMPRTAVPSPVVRREVEGGWCGRVPRKGLCTEVLDVRSKSGGIGSGTFRERMTTDVRLPDHQANEQHNQGQAGHDAYHDSNDARNQLAHQARSFDIALPLLLKRRSR